MTLESLFRRCLSIEYIHIEGDGSYATERIGNTLYIYFQGSNGALDWKNNFDFPTKPYKRMGKRLWLVHRGFLRVWKSLEEYIMPLIMEPELEKIIICGYSHGGALAVFCHEFVWYNRPDLRKHIFGYGIGAPRVVWGLFNTCLSRWEGFTVVRNIDDIVTHLPPVIFGFIHVGKLMKIGHRGKYSMIDAHRSENILKELSSQEKATQV